jgi:LysR family transcriptional regulator, transcriptional activator of the cysJI operon
MDARRLEAFQAVARHRSFTRAALELHLSQSAVSQQIAALETELGGPLFDRSQRRVRLTPAGAALLDRVDAILAGLAQARRAVAAARGAVEGDLRVSASRTVGTYLLPRPLAAIGRRHPGLRLRVTISNSERVVAALLAGAADVAFVEDEVEHAGITVEPLLEDELVVVAPAGHRLAAAPEVALADLAAEPLILREPGSGTRRVAEQHLRAAGLAPEELRVAAELSEIEAIKASVEAGLGVSILSRATLAKELALGTLVARPVAGLSIRRRMAAVTLTGAIALPAARELIARLAARDASAQA